MNKIFIICLMALIMTFNLASGQLADTANSKPVFQKFSISAALGTAIYQGDLSAFKIGFRDDQRFTSGLSFNYRINPSISLGLSYLNAKLMADETMYPADNWRSQRRLKFSSPLNEIAFQINWEIYHPKSIKFKPFITPYIYAGAGVGFIKPELDLSNYDADYYENAKLIEDLTYNAPKTIITLPVGVGVKAYVSEKVGIFAEIGHRVTNSDRIDRISNWDNLEGNDGYSTYRGGVSLLFGSKSSKIKDVDKDGVADDKDECPTIAGLATMNGCPDTDGDGVSDLKDKCPMIKGVVENYGCPNNVDSDKDGVSDNVDDCPNVYGSAKYHGCPVPDTDGDGFNDETDKCINTYSLTNFGCPEVRRDVINKVNRAAKNIYFDSDRSTLRPESYANLDVIASILLEDQTLNVDIEGNTDNTGIPAKNMILSDDRANVCLDYLVTKGVARERMTARGFGDSRPVATNSTPAGKQLNRRTEFKLRTY